MVTATRWETARQVLAQAEASMGVRTRLRGATALASPLSILRPVQSPSSAADPAQEVDALPRVDPEEILPVPPALAGLFPEGGVRRGSTVQVSGGMSVLLALAAAAMGEESWCALVDLPDAGLAAAATLGLVLERVVVVPRPGPEAPVVLAAVADGFDVLVLGRGAGLAERDRRSLTSRLRVRGAVLLTTAAWPGADVVLRAVSRTWQGVGRGDGLLRTGVLELAARHRRFPTELTARVQLGSAGLAPAGLGTAPDAARPGAIDEAEPMIASGRPAVATSGVGAMREVRSRVQELESA
ncbi:hypothetical protein [Ruania albidiflava]|uniref:hypothetical protein n=1 Tax=Ruania albidiflava TaxID=366586 RepID=UPI0003B5DB3F|nr:hypothetical protein [Ruania albidiflava]